MTTWNVKVARTVCLGAASYLVLAAVSGAALAQTSTGSQPSSAPGNTTTLSPVIVQSNTARPARKRTAQSATRARSQNTANANRGRGAGQDQAAAGSGQRSAETARGHVDGYVANRSATGTKTDTPLIETPAAISVITQDQIQAQAAQSVPQAVRYTSGVRGEQTGADARFNSIAIRGFTADQYLDGMKLFTSGFSASIVEPFNLERIEVLHGPASILYGQGSPGGVIDMVSKRPTVDPYHEVFVSTGSYGRVQGGVDVSGPIDQKKEWLYRLTASGFDVGTQVDHTSYQRVSIAPSLTWRPDNDTTITFLGTYQNDPKAGFYNLLPRTGVLFPYGNGSRIPTNFYNGEPNVDRMNRELGQVGYLAEHRFNNVWTVRQNLRYTDLSSDITTVYYTGATTTPTIPRSAFFEGDRLKTLQIDNQAEGKFYTGPFQHTLLFGVDYQNGSFGTTAGGPTSAVPPQNVFNPQYGLSLPMVPTSKSFQDFNQV
ncbi:MAG TPA: TonB-dependent receptor plug domain-containing protein, partial [Afipia sp.]